MTSTTMTERSANWGEAQERVRKRRRYATVGAISVLALLMLPLVPFAAGFVDGLFDRPHHEPAWTTPVGYAGAFLIIVGGLALVWRRSDEWEQRRIVNGLAVAGLTSMLLYPVLAIIAALGAHAVTPAALWRVPLFAMAVAIITQRWRAARY